MEKVIMNRIYELCSDNLDIDMFESMFLTDDNKLFITINDKDYEINITQATENNGNYTTELENGLMSALDMLSQCKENFDYYDTLRELTNWGNFQALEFLEKFGDNED